MPPRPEQQVLTTQNSSETEAVGARLAGRLVPGDLVLVEGDVGAGKSTLVRGACWALGVRGPITSPTFTIGHLYAGTRVIVAHLDLYRLSSLEEEDPALLADYVAPDRITFVEWPGVGKGHWADHPIRVTIAHLGGDRRRIELLADA